MAFVDDFVAAFNARDLDALANCVTPDATARVEGAPFPEEVGRETIRDTSFAYLLGDAPKLHGEVVRHADTSILLLDEQGRVEVAIQVEEIGGRGRSLVYFTMPNAPERLMRIARDLGRPVAEP